MGACTSKPSRRNPYLPEDFYDDDDSSGAPKRSPFFPYYSPSPAKKNKSPARQSTASSTPRRKGRFPPPSRAKHVMGVLRRRHGTVKPKVEVGAGLDKRFGLSKGFTDRYEVGEEVGRGHFGYTVSATCKSGDRIGQRVAVKVIPKTKMTTAIAVEDVRREVKILRALAGHSNLVLFYDAFEDDDNAYIVMELCEGGELLDRILSRGGKFSEADSKTIIVQILNVVSFCHLQGVVHRDLKPELYADEKLNDIVGSSYYVAPEVLRRSYSTEADVWSVGVIAYILLCGSRPFWARTESGVFNAVVKADPAFDQSPWPSLSSGAKDFVKCLLNKDPRKRMTAAEALCHPWIRDHNRVEVPIDVHILRLLKLYAHSSPLRRIALRALSKTLTADDLFYLEKQFALLAPEKSENVTLESIKMALMKNATDAMKASRITDYHTSLIAPQHGRLDFEEFCAAAVCVHQLEAFDRWEQHARCAFEIFDKDGNRTIVIQELASELGLSPLVPVHAVLNDWIRHTDGKLSFHGFVKLLHGVSDVKLR